MPTATTADRKIGDLVLYECDERYTRDARTITNPEANVNTFPCGYPLDAGVPILDAAEAGVDGLLLVNNDWDATASESKSQAVLSRGPAIINKSEIVVTDYNGGTMDIVAIVAALTAIGIKVVDVPAETEAQET